MNARQLFAELEQAGVILAPRGDRLHLDAPKGVISDEIRHQMVRHKPELLRLVQVAAMKLDDFARAGLIVEVRSEVLGADVLFVSDNVPTSNLGRRPEVVYRAQELKKLARLPPDPRGLRDVQMVKEIFGGAIQGIRRLEQGQPDSATTEGIALNSMAVSGDGDGDMDEHDRRQATQGTVPVSE